MTRIGEHDESTRSGIDQLIECARDAVVNRAVAERYVQELDRWARPAPAVRRWVPWLAAGLAAAAVVLALRWRGGPALDPTAPVQIGARVAIVSAPGTIYRVVWADAGGTEIAVDRGAVTARLWRSGAPHRLVLSGGGITATATGTVYSLAIAATGPVVGVTEGSVEIRAADGLHVITAGASWPETGRAADPGAAYALLALPAPVAAPPPSDAADAVKPDGSASPPGVAEDAAEPPPAPRHPAAPSGTANDPAAIKERWHTARLLRSQARFAAALVECIAIADAHDPMWSAIALVEAVRIELGPLADPERAIAIADRMIREWPADMLVPEARALRCRALQQLGRAGECAPTTQP